MFVGNIAVRVVDIVEETSTIKRFKLAPIENKPLPVFSGGSHITTIVQKNEAILERHYSLISHPTKQRDFYEIAISLNDKSSGGSLYWHTQMKIGDELEISLPKNQFALSYQAKHHVFFAAGIGITPFLTMIEDLQVEGKTFELHYAAKSKEVCAFYDALSELSTQVYFYFSEEGNRLVPDMMKDFQIGTHVYFCGPNQMIREFTDAARSYGYPEKGIHFELFSPPVYEQMDAFQVRLQESNQTIDVPEGATLLDTLLENGINARYSCKAGGCGSCEIEVLEGEVEHRDVFYTEEERKGKQVILSCISRAKSKKLVLNL